MDEAARVRERDGFADAFEEAQALGQVGTCRSARASVSPADALHHVEEPAIGEAAGVVNRDDAGMFEPGEDRASPRSRRSSSRWPARSAP